MSKREFNPIESFPSPMNGYCNMDWACQILAQKINHTGSPRGIRGRIKPAMDNGTIKTFRGSGRQLYLYREDVIKFVNESPVKRISKNRGVDYHLIEEIVRKVIREEFSK